MTLILRNPHSVLAALETRPDDVLEIRHGPRPKGAWNEVVRRAVRHRIPVVQTDAEKRGRRNRGKKSDDVGRLGSTAATVKERNGLSLEQLFAGVASPPADSAAGSLWLALDRIQDPHNLGAIFRSAAFFGVQGVVLTRDQSAPLNATVYDTSAGGIEYVPFSVQPNLGRALETAKEAGLWVLGSAEQAGQDVFDVDRGRPWLLVLGNEEKGLRRLTREKCDELCRLTPHGAIHSLNVSVAAGALMSALTRS